MLARYKHFDTILLPLNAADPSYLSFETQVLEEARKQNLGIQGMKVWPTRSCCSPSASKSASRMF